MKTKKNIDRLFNEQFKDFEVSPPDIVWDQIKDRLQEKKKKRTVIVPMFWLRSAGVAAALMLVFTLGVLFMKNNTTSNTVVNIPAEQTPTLHRPESNQTLTDTEDLENKNVTIEGAITTKSLENSNTKSQTKRETTGSIQKQQSIALAKASQAVTTTAPAADENQVESTQSERIDKIATPQQQVVDTPVVAAQTVDKTDTKAPEESSALTAVQSEQPKAKDNKKSLVEFAQQKNVDKEDVAQIQLNEGSRWAVSPNFIPLYYNTMGNGSSIDSEFSSNSKSGDINYGYGLQVSYDINDRLSVRTGVNKVDLGYVTNNIEFVAATSDYAISSIDYPHQEYIIAVGRTGQLNINSQIAIVDNSGRVIIPRNGAPIEGQLRQTLNYFEVPLELKYSIVNKKIGVNLIGGVSTLFLTDNSIQVDSPIFKTTVGKANNLNDVSFSSNIGLGFDYKISKRFLFNIEPMLKYQLNPYNASTDFKPYYLGVYSGFSYRF